MVKKICSKCKIEKPFYYFGSFSHTLCRTCYNQTHKKHKEKDSEKIREKRRINSQRWRELYPERVREQHEKYRIANRDKIHEYYRQWYQRDQRKYYHEHREKFLVYQYRRIDKKHNHICNLTPQWIKEHILSKSCVYCGDTENIGCDRIDNTKGHIIDNVVPCCSICNATRMNNYNTQEMYILGSTIKKIKELRKKSIIPYKIETL